MRLALAQLNTTVGDIDGNCRRIADSLRRAEALGADLVVAPEMAVTGYPPEDLLLKPDFVDNAWRALQDLAAECPSITAVVGCVRAGEDLYNSAVVLHGGKTAGWHDKRFLPNYGVFDEDRYFAKGRRSPILELDDAVVGLSVCEDMWYPGGAPEEQAAAGAGLLVNVSASPYHRGKGQARERMLCTRAADNAAFVAYCNLVGGQDELIFDGHSLVCGPDGDVIARGRQFEEDLLVVDLDMRRIFRHRLHDSRLRKLARPAAPERLRLETTARERAERVEPVVAPLCGEVEEVYRALVLGTRDYVTKNGFSDVVLGLSGGIDSSLVAVVAADALGPERVHGVAMPSRYSSRHSLDDAGALCANLGIDYRELSIEGPFAAFQETLAETFRGREEDVTEENIQPRVRAVLLMALSNKFGWLVLATGNKSEVGVGYSTIYGDTAGGFAVIKDVPKTLVYELCRWRNGQGGREVVPASVLAKPPSAELRPDQKDTDTLPDYAELDPILHAYVEQSLGVEDIVRLGHDEATVKRVMRMVDRNEYKRRQSPPGIRITSRAFGKDWRVPVTNRYPGR